MLSKITETTLIPLSAAVIAIGGGAAFITNLHAMTVSNAQNLEQIATRQERYAEDIHSIKLQLLEIRTEIKRLK